MKLKGKRTKVTGVIMGLFNIAAMFVPELNVVREPVNAILVASLGWFLHDKD
jgi:hypothetical protein